MSANNAQRVLGLPDNRTNLPLALTSLVGREQELAQLEPLVLTSRLLTLTGSGGAGKTRLALELARRVLGEFEDGAWLVELAPLTDETLVPAVVAEALGLVDRSGSLIDTLAAFLKRTSCCWSSIIANILSPPALSSSNNCSSAAAWTCASWRPAASRSAFRARLPGACPRSRCPQLSPC